MVSPTTTNQAFSPALTGPYLTASAAYAADKELKYLAYLGAGETRLEGGSFKEAADIFQKIMADGAATSEARDRAALGLVRALYGMKSFDEAVDAGIEQLERGIKL